MNTATVTLVKVEDHEGNGECSECGRTGLRWIATLSDGTTVGVECAKKVMGWKPAPKTYAWTADFAATAEHIECGETFILWTAKTGNATRETRNGNLTAVGGVRQAWTARGWA
jgi:hypothetical protein